MNAVEIEQAISELAEQPFDAAEFPYALLIAFGNKETTIKRLRTGASNKSDVGGVLQTNNIHIKACVVGEIAVTLDALRASPVTTRAKAKFILATDGTDLEAEDITKRALPGGQVFTKVGQPSISGWAAPRSDASAVRIIRPKSFGS